MPKLTLCMIVKNEEDVLARCLGSVTGKNPQPDYAGDAPKTRTERSACPIDEIVVADTGSTDGTKKIAASFGAKIYDFAWNDDFSAARNFSFSKATGDYILWLDADDYIDETDRLRLHELKNTLQKNGAAGAFCRYEIGSAEKADISFYRMRVVKNDGNAVWSGRVHECLPHFSSAITHEFTVRHLGSKKARGTRNLDIYRKQILAGEAMSPRDLFYYGRELFYHGFFTESVAVEERFLREKDGWYVNKIEACKIIAQCRLRTGDAEGAKNALFSSFLYGAPRAGCLCLLGQIYKDEKDFSSAYFWYTSAKSAVDHTREGDFENPADRTSTPSIEAVYCAYAMGNHALAYELQKECERLFLSHPSVIHNRTFFQTHPVS